MKEMTINHLAVWVAIVLVIILGFLWYGPVFGNQWMHLVGLDQAAVEANPPGIGTWIANVIATVVPIYMLAWLYVKMGVASPSEGGLIGLLIGFSFVFLSDMTNNLFAQNDYALSWITGGYSMVGLALSGLILGAWRKYKE